MGDGHKMPSEETGGTLQDKELCGKSPDHSAKHFPISLSKCPRYCRRAETMRKR